MAGFICFHNNLSPGNTYFPSPLVHLLNSKLNTRFIEAFLIEYFFNIIYKPSGVICLFLRYLEGGMQIHVTFYIADQERQI